MVGSRRKRILKNETDSRGVTGENYGMHEGHISYDSESRHTTGSGSSTAQYSNPGYSGSEYPVMPVWVKKLAVACAAGLVALAIGYLLWNAYQNSMQLANTTPGTDYVKLDRHNSVIAERDNARADNEALQDTIAELKAQIADSGAHEVTIDGASIAKLKIAIHDAVINDALPVVTEQVTTGVVAGVVPELDGAVTGGVLLALDQYDYATLTDRIDHTIKDAIKNAPGRKYASLSTKSLNNLAIAITREINKNFVGGNNNVAEEDCDRIVGQCRAIHLDRVQRITGARMPKDK